MGKFKYSDDELDMNKVLKMNQDRSMALFEDADLADSRKEADSNIASTIALLKSLGKGKQVQELADEISQKSFLRMNISSLKQICKNQFTDFNIA